MQECFRPLTGILFFNSPSEKPCYSSPEQAVCGAETERSVSGRCWRCGAGFRPCVARRGADAALFPDGGCHSFYSPLRRRFLLCCRFLHQKTDQTHVWPVVFAWWRHRDLNSGHCGYEPHALANWAMPPKWWAGMDSNHRNPKMTDLQSVPFNHSGTYPFLTSVKNKI